MPRRHSPFNEGITKDEKLLAVLGDGTYHSTQELARRVGHRFGNAIYQLRRRGHTIECAPHPTKKYQHQYRLIDDQ